MMHNISGWMRDPARCSAASAGGWRMIRMPIDREWFLHHMTGEILPRWLHKSPRPDGGFEARLGRTWEVQPGGVCTLVSQGRLLYNFAEGWRFTREQAYLEAVSRGADFMMERMADRRHGGWYWSVAWNGAVADASKNTYGHAFAVFGLAHAWAATGRPEVRTAALEGWDAVSRRLRDARGGFCAGMSEDFTEVQPGRSINPIMHLFEALLHGGELMDEPRLHEEAEALASFALGLVDPHRGLIAEVYSDEWKALAAEAGGRFEIGHQFEWAWLLSRAAELGVCPQHLARAERLLDTALECGMDHRNGAIRSVLDPGGSARPGPFVYWVECEALRALLHFAYVRSRNDLLGPAHDLYAFIRTRFLDPLYGGWFEAVDEAGVPVPGPKGHLWKLDYHVVGLCSEAMRVMPPRAF